MEELIHGAKWWKFDFHNHTPASFDFGKGNQNHKSITPRDWLLMYMKEGIDCVAITDHNSGKWVDELKRALQELEEEEDKPNDFRKLYLFPGVEITANNNIHILALFDPSKGTNDIQYLLGSIGFPGDHIGTSDAVSPDSVEVIINKIHSAGAIAIPAHVDKACGLFNLTGHTLTQTLKTEGLLAIEVIDKSVEKPELYMKMKLRLAEIIGTDSHIAAQVGTNYTWVKMGEPSLDALKLALHDKEDGIIRKDEIEVDPNLISNRYFIKSLSVKNGFKAGNRGVLNVNFSPWLTSVIGGRGSGKSSIINYLRIALARVDEMPADIQTEFNKFYKIGKKHETGMLRDNTIIEVEIYKDGVLHLIKWSNNTHTLQRFNIEAKIWSDPVTITNIKELFPIQIFNQKELYALTKAPSKLIELIDSQFAKSDWVKDKQLLMEKWIANCAHRRSLIAAVNDEANIKAELEAVTSKIALFESSEYKETLNRFNKLTETKKFFANINSSIEDFGIKLQQIEQVIPCTDIPETISEEVVDDSLAFINQLSSAFDAIKIKLTEALSIISPYKENLQEQINSLSWFHQYESVKQAYEHIASNFKDLGTENYEQLIKRKATINEKLSLINNKKDQLSALEKGLGNLFHDIINHEKQLRIYRLDVISKWKAVDGGDNPFLTIELHQMADVQNAESSFRELLRKSNGEFSNDIYSYDEEGEIAKGIIARITDEPETTRWEKRNNEIQEFISSTALDKKNIDLRLAKHLDFLKQNFPEDVDRLFIWFPEDKLVLKFKKNGKEEDIQTGSAGERTAGMLGLLMALNEIPLIIDQPEDDLDTKLISNFVVEGFKNIKRSRQLLVVTHNPNIAVNANSDNIVHMEFHSGEVIKKANNALQDKDIRTAVCEVMEGGREALNNRYYRISKALKS